MALAPICSPQYLAQLGASVENIKMMCKSLSKGNTLCYQIALPDGMGCRTSGFYSA
ncbi:protein of unknown function [Magnetospirillum gryphiswaldense MSR-1 v2]|uniref:Uncharacterized protein n=1 Tax=Magnetospirillum gryphiswaldense (strain DSM 6361 / JCM 21280 / NBRC 15271 / MSR-1) TaxID=431944 RepID=V6EZV9_MAGGM|nr:protein of unknown function [Magnetospirillum gryphiswaldense MSR-1 v2]